MHKVASLPNFSNQLMTTLKIFFIIVVIESNNFFQAALVSSILQIAVTVSSAHVVGSIEQGCSGSQLACLDPMHFRAPQFNQPAGISAELDWTLSAGEHITFTFK